MSSILYFYLYEILERQNYKDRKHYQGFPEAGDGIGIEYKGA